jgi:hypothetical protein
VYSVERGAVLYCTARGSTVCFTFERLLRGLYSILDTERRKYLPHTRKRARIECEPFGISTIFKEKEMITRQSVRDKPIYLGTTHVLNLRQNTMRTGFDPETIHIKSVVDKLVVGQVLLRESRILM